VGKPHFVVYRGYNNRELLIPFTVVVCSDVDGREVWWANASRAIVPFAAIVPPALASPRDVDCARFGTTDQHDRALAPGSYTISLRGSGAFQLTDKSLDPAGNATVNASMDATTVAWTFTPTNRTFVDFAGPVSVEEYDFTTDTNGAHSWTTPATLTAEPGGSYVYTLRGAPGASYTIAMRPAGAAAVPARVDGAPIAGVLAVAAAATILLGRRRVR
jgi:hypothetical protein